MKRKHLSDIASAWFIIALAIACCVETDNVWAILAMGVNVVAAACVLQKVGISNDKNEEV